MLRMATPYFSLSMHRGRQVRRAVLIPIAGGLHLLVLAHFLCPALALAARIANKQIQVNLIIYLFGDQLDLHHSQGKERFDCVQNL